MAPPNPEPQTDRSGYLAVDTIAALATPLGGAIAIIRLSGPQTHVALARLGATRALEHPRELLRVALRGVDGAVVDDAMVASFPGPASFTGEDCAELHLHGSSIIATRLLEDLAKLGVRQALAGEFSFRAVRNGKMTLSQAEAVADLIASSNETAAALALDKLSGLQNRQLGGLAEALRQLATLGEIGIDFADQDVEEVGLPRLKERAQGICTQLITVGESFARGTRIQDGISVAFVGRPNAGKSSFFNALLGEDRSIVSEIAGTTRDVVRERLVLRGKRGSVTLRLEDTAGLRITSDAVEKIGIERSRQAASRADIVLWIVDSAAMVVDTDERQALLREWAALGAPADRTVGILTKLDLLDLSQVRELRAAVAELGIPVWAEVSSTLGEGMSAAAALIADFAERWVHRQPGELVLTRIDHLESVNATVLHLKRAVGAPEIDLFASDIRQALLALAPLIGDTVADDILGRVFSQFCIGK